MVSCGGGGSTSGSDSTSAAEGGSSDDNSLIAPEAPSTIHLFSKMFSEYNKLNGLKVNYQSVGSGAGIPN